MDAKQRELLRAKRVHLKARLDCWEGKTSKADEEIKKTIQDVIDLIDILYTPYIRSQF